MPCAPFGRTGWTNTAPRLRRRHCGSARKVCFQRTRATIRTIRWCSRSGSSSAPPAAALMSAARLRFPEPTHGRAAGRATKASCSPTNPIWTPCRTPRAARMPWRCSPKPWRMPPGNFIGVRRCRGATRDSAPWAISKPQPERRQWRRARCPQRAQRQTPPARKTCVALLPVYRPSCADPTPPCTPNGRGPFASTQVFQPQRPATPFTAKIWRPGRKA